MIPYDLIFHVQFEKELSTFIIHPAALFNFRNYICTIRELFWKTAKILQCKRYTDILTEKIIILVYLKATFNSNITLTIPKEINERKKLSIFIPLYHTTLTWKVKFYIIYRRYAVINRKTFSILTNVCSSCTITHLKFLRKFNERKKKKEFVPSNWKRLLLQTFGNSIRDTTVFIPTRA